MRASVRVSNPDQVEITLSMTMTVERWKDLRKEVLGMDAPFYGPTQALRQAIDDLVAKACGNFDIEVEEGN